MKEMFIKFDSNTDGKITRDEFAKYLRGMNKSMISLKNEGTIDNLVAQADDNNDDWIRLGEFTANFSLNYISNSASKGNIVTMIARGFTNIGSVVYVV